jgi:hypothetical protein
MSGPKVKEAALAFVLMGRSNHDNLTNAPKAMT